MRNPSDLPPRRPRQSGGGFTFNKPSRGRIVAAVIVAALVALVISGRSIASFYVNVLWFDVLGRTDVYWIVLATKALLGAVFVAVFLVIIVVNLWLADRIAPAIVAPSPEERALAGLGFFYLL